MVFILAITMLSCINDDFPVENGPLLVIGNKIPNFSIEMNDGNIITGENLRKCKSVIVFFHTSCPDCQQTLPIIQRLYDKYKNQEIVFTLISREEEEASIASFWKSKELNMPYSPQTTRKVYELFAQSGIPLVLISNTNGVITSIFTDTPNPTYEELKLALDRL